MIDFCDEDSFATLPEVTIKSGDTIKDYLLKIKDDIEYCGNEKVPYFNEFSFSLTGYRSLPTYVDPDDPTNPDKMRYTFYLGNPEVNLEMLQMYMLQKNELSPAISGGKCAVRIYVHDIKYKVDEDAEVSFIEALKTANVLKTDADEVPPGDPYLEIDFHYDAIWCRYVEDIPKSVKIMTNTGSSPLITCDTSLPTTPLAVNT